MSFVSDFTHIKSGHCASILWADDEIDLLRPHIMFLEAKGYRVTPVASGTDAMKRIASNTAGYDIVFLDENMPGLSGLDTLDRIKDIAPLTPVVLITKNDDEHIMDLAVGSRIADYLIKPVNPSQILLSLKKVLHSRKLICENDSRRCREKYLDMNTAIDRADTIGDWHEIYRRLIHDSISLSRTQSDTAAINDSLIDTAEDAFFRFVRSNYMSWIRLRDTADHPVMSPDILDRNVLPLMRSGKRPVMMLIDNLTLGQWIIARPVFTEAFRITSEEIYTAILPTSTQYCRNAILSGMMPDDIRRRFPQLWIDEHSSDGKNRNEETLLHNWAEKHGFQKNRISYRLTTDTASLQSLRRSFRDSGEADDLLTVIIVNFSDMLSHAVARTPMLRELATSDSALRNIFLSWLRHSPLQKLLRHIAEAGRPLIVTTDHGSIRVSDPVRTCAGEDATDALRYKFGKNISAASRSAFMIRKPEEAGLPATSISTSCIIAGRREFLLYPNNFSHYARTFSGSFQHGGISMQEMLLPITTLTPKIND